MAVIRKTNNDLQNTMEKDERLSNTNPTKNRR